MVDPDTIAAISTAPGPGGIGMVRITGPLAIPLARAIFSPERGWDDGREMIRRAIFGRVHPPKAPDDPIDTGILLLFRGPFSYTGEDTAEITAHGGPLVMRAVLEAALAAGARLAEPGEFTRRAFLNGRLELSQAEAVAALIFASTDDARRVMYRQLEGALGGEAGRIRDLLLEAKVLLEAAIDFPEDVPESDLGRVERILTTSLENTTRLLATSRKGIALNEGLSVVIAGTPNVGKSSLLNALLCEDRAIVHEVAGTTRDFIEGRMEVFGVPVRVVDTAGIRDGADQLEVEGILRTRRLMELADLVLVVIDASRPQGPGDEALLAETEQAARVVAFNKNDLPRAQGLVLQEGSVSVSARTGQGMDDLRRAIHKAVLGQGPAESEGGAVVTTVRQAEALGKVQVSCNRALEGHRAGMGPECVAVDLDEALMGLGELTGESVSSEEVLGRIFSRFCVGK